MGLTIAERKKIMQEISNLELLQADTLTKTRSRNAVMHIHNRIQHLKRVLNK